METLWEVDVRRDGQGPNRDVNRVAESRIKSRMEEMLYVGVDDVEIMDKGETVRVTMSRWDLELALEALRGGE